MAAAMDRAAILSTEWAEAPTENGEPGTAGTVFEVNNPQDFARGIILVNHSCGRSLACFGEPALGTTEPSCATGTMAEGTGE